jgi:hypothetical protein
MKNKKTLYHFILDNSGSMTPDRANTVNLFNRQVATVRSLAITYPEQNFLTGLTVFNERINHIMRETPVHKLTELGLDRYRPNGYTALYDAIGESVSGIKERFGVEIEKGEMSVVVIILTDGHENASMRFDQRMIAAMIDELQATDCWTFTILGADFDITSVSEGMKIGKQSAFNYSKSNFHNMSADVEKSLKSYAASKSKGIIDKSFFTKGDDENVN